MMFKRVRRGAHLLASCSLFALGLAALAGGQALAAETPTAAAVAPETVTTETEVEPIQVTMMRGKAADVAPVTSTIKATEPEAIITRKAIEESSPRVGDYTTTAILAPSMATAPNANGSGATDGAKISMRGFSDGEFIITYDGIAWGDTNGPTHHANSFFPSSTIGGVVIKRGPGSAGDFGLANFGGSLNLYSLPFEDQLSARQTVTFGSFGTIQGVTTLATGPVASLHGASAVLNFMEYKTDGYLSHSSSDGFNQFAKINVPITDKFSVTALYTHNYNSYLQGDNSALGNVLQNETYGRRYALSDNPNWQTYYKYNFTKKSTEFGYIREDLDLGNGLKVNNTTYEYFYGNRTVSAANNAADGSLTPAALTAANMVIVTPPAAYPAGGSAYPASAKVAGIPGYLKFNHYRVRGDTFRLEKDFGFGTFRTGVLFETAKTKRYRFDINLLTWAPDYREKAAALPGKSGCNGLPAQVAPGKAYNGACQEPLNIAYLEYSGWHQYQPYAEFEWRPRENLTITPGVKYVHYEVYVHAPAIAVSSAIQPSYTSATSTKLLPFLTVNYRVQPNWAVYAEYAQGFLVPDISSFYVNNPTQKVVPQQSTNYQLGTVYNVGHLALDADIYYIQFKNKIQSNIDLATNESYTSNSGGATYKGIEVQATYQLPHGVSVFANGTINEAIAKNDPINPGANGRQIAKAPRGTAAAGLRWEHHGLFTSDDSLTTTINDKFIGSQTINPASGTAGPTGRIKSFSQANLSSTYHFGHYSLQAQILNIGDSQSITSAKGKALFAGTNYLATTVAGGGSANVFTYQVGRSYQVTLKVVF